MASDGCVNVQASDEESIIEGLCALVRLITRTVLEELPGYLENKEPQESSMAPEPRELNRSSHSQRLVLADELSEMLSLPRSSIWRLARNGTIPSVRIGRQVRFDKKAVKKALQIGIS